MTPVLRTLARSPIHDGGITLRSSSFDPGTNSIDLVWSTGAVVRRATGYSGTIDEELSMNPNHVRLDRLNRSGSLLDSHNGSQLSRVLGRVVQGTARIERGHGLARVQLSQAEGHADIIRNIRDGVLANISVGYRIHRIEKTDGADRDVPLWRVVDWEPLEISVVAVPADPGCQIREGKLQAGATLVELRRRRMQLKAAAAGIG